MKFLLDVLAALSLIPCVFGFHRKPTKRRGTKAECPFCGETVAL